MNVLVSLEGNRYRISEPGVPLGKSVTFDKDAHSYHGAKIPLKRLLAKVSADSINWERLELTPHSHGVHTESVSHITDTLEPVHGLLSALLIPCTLVTVPNLGRDSFTALRNRPKAELVALVVRTSGKRLHFTPAAMELVVELGVQHLLVDQLSVDPEVDGGKLLCHRLFWGLPPESSAFDDARFPRKTITELATVPKDIQDGLYFLNLQVPMLNTDAVPSRPMLFAATLEGP